MTTLRGSTAGAFTSNARTLTLPGGTVAGDIAVVFGYDGYVSPVLSTITGWNTVKFATGAGDGLIAWKVLTSADITAGSVTVTWSNSYAGYAALSTVLASSGANVTVSSISAFNGDTGTGRTISVNVRNTDTALYLAFKRKDGTSPTVSLSRGTSVDASAVTNAGGAYSTEAISSTGSVDVTSIVPSGGNVDGLVAVVVSDSSAPGGVPDPVAVGSGGARTGFLYKGRRTAADDTGSNA